MSDPLISHDDAILRGLRRHIPGCGCTRWLGFRQVNIGRSNAHHDALEFPDGRIVLLTQLCKGQHATMLQLPVTSPVTADEAQRHGSLVA
jgi:hypothetical protein